VTEKKKAADTSRLGFVDDARGLAVVLMIFWHTVDGWLHPAHKVGQGYQTMVSFGGLAAPMFLFLAGAGAALKIAADGARHAEGRYGPGARLPRPRGRRLGLRAARVHVGGGRHGDHEA
jgi:uncharacterized membrane protein